VIASEMMDAMAVLRLRVLLAMSRGRVCDAPLPKETGQGVAKG